jgi:hypothetical protein
MALLTLIDEEVDSRPDGRVKELERELAGFKSRLDELERRYSDDNGSP